MLLARNKTAQGLKLDRNGKYVFAISVSWDLGSDDDGNKKS